MGLAVGDALGVPNEFKPRGSFKKVTEMVGGGPFYLKPGEWTDDTSMALCLGKSLVDCDGFNAKDQMDKYWNWVEAGYMSSNGRMFDIGDTTSEALCKYRKTGNPFASDKDKKYSGNGSLMRLAPIPMFYPTPYENRNGIWNCPDCIHFAAAMSETTHASPECVYSCAYMAGLIVAALNDKPKEEILSKLYFPNEPEMWGRAIHLVPADILDILVCAYKDKVEPNIKSTGYVIHTLEAALWCFYTTNNFEDGCIKAVNLGEDTDTVGAVYGQLAGAYYGISSIPERWLAKIVLPNIIIELADKLLEKRK